ncbi:siderophore-interacting protein [Pseudogemmobacter sonorensis]|uniref:siderophore-interacting protein n=1 Tax=Pseudogemmobacter sonorensis TaxID=2989681 RepID=UPI0036953572
MAQMIAFIEIPASTGIPLLCDRADALGAHVTRGAEEATIQANSGSIGVRPVPGGVELAVTSDSDAGLQMLRGAIDGFAVQAGIPAPTWQSAPSGRAAKSRLMSARVLSGTRISPSYYRIRLAGDFTAFAKGGLHFRLLIGPDGMEWPEAGPEGIIWPGGIEAWHRPPYTVRAVSPEGDWLDFDVFLHQGGRVTEWCQNITPGAQVMLTGPSGRGVKQAAWMGIIGDETALPVVLRAIEAAAPESGGQAFILISDPSDRQPVAVPPGMTLHWIPRIEGRPLTDLLKALSPPDSDRFIFFAGERREAEDARLWASTAGLGTGEFHAAAYWTAGWVPPAAQRQARGDVVIPADAE